MIALKTLAQQFEAELLAVNSLAAKELFEEALQHTDLTECLDLILTPALENIGRQWETGEAALSQVYMSGIICEEIVNSWAVQLAPPSQKPPRIAVVTFEDYHVLGKRILQSILSAKGVRTLDYGHGVQKDELVARVMQDEIETLLISTLMLPAALRITLVREELDNSGRKVNIIVGGAPFRFDDQLWKRVGADAMGRTASDAIKIIQQLGEE